MQCGACYTPWNKCIDIHYKHGQKNQPSEPARSASRKKWQKEEWTDWGYSPRRRSQPHDYAEPSPRKRPKTPKKKKQTEQNYGAPTLDPPWQHAGTGSSHPQTTVPAMGKAETSLLTELVHAIETSDRPIPEEVQTVIEKAKRPIEPPPTTAKTVRQAFDKLEKKRKGLQQAHNARSKLHTSWTQYVEESIKRWKSFATDFATKDAELEKKVNEAREAVQEAKSKYDTAKEDNDRQDRETVEEPEEISDGMDEDNHEKMATSEEIQANITMMVTNLENLRMRQPPDPEQQALKKQRTDAGEDGVAPGFGSSALKPFPAPGK